jgi:protein-disulfide isomerase
MICFIALFVFGILGIFSATHRKLALEALDCVFRRVTLRKCESRLDKRIKSRITGKLMSKSPKVAGFVFKHFELISWFFTVILILSVVYTGYGFYNYVNYGNCNGPENNGGFCIFDPAGTHSQYSGIKTGYEDEIIYPDVDDDPSLGNKNADVVIIEFGCFRCPYTKKAEKVVDEILEYYGDKVYYVYRDFPLTTRHVNADIHAEAANCALDQNKYWEYHDLLFEKQDEMLNHTSDDLIKLGEEVGLNNEEFKECILTRKYKDEVQKDYEDGYKAKIYGTPTFFINKERIVGPREFKDFKKVIDKELKKSMK